MRKRLAPLVANTTVRALTVFIAASLVKGNPGSDPRRIISPSKIVQDIDLYLFGLTYRSAVICDSQNAENP